MPKCWTLVEKKLKMLSSDGITNNITFLTRLILREAKAQVKVLALDGKETASSL